MDERKDVDAMLVQLFGDMMEWEEKSLITEEFRDITNNDMHIIDVIGIEKAKNMSTIARQLKVTTGTLTIAVNNLLKKGYVERTRGQRDKRVVFISLSEKGKRAYRRHEHFHYQMVDQMLKCLNEEETNALIKGLRALCSFMNDKVTEEDYER
ncbi:MAG: MarR family transcriptional regulator [Lachnospiraceae bacterium]|nr:MarR family transcriptional regulator [Lachnospiraceae bacterium]